MTRIKFILLLFFLLPSLIFAQANMEEIVVRFYPKVNINKWQEKHLSVESSQLIFKQIISKRFNLAVLSYDKNQLSFTQVQDFLSEDDDVIWITPNKVNAEFRTTPNDPSYSVQWGLSEIGLEQFWDISTGGLTVTGDTIVVAIMENGHPLEHEDLIDNIWHNYQEIPDDNIDNDNNGYIDDFTGWNSALENDFHEYAKHGTEISGVIGAKGNNELGISGVNWDIKLMPLSFNSANISTYFSAFDYLIDQRRLYNETDGQKGAFIVAVNESFGISNAKPDQNEGWNLWCEYMDSLGQVGILTVCATSNDRQVNVDIEGDMPSTCPQDYLIAVTSIDNNSNRRGAYGKKHIDLAAPGIDIYSTSGFNSMYTYRGGTSVAAPHVTGIIGLIYSYPCERWSNYIKTNPAEAALLAKEWILNNTVPLPSTEGETVTEGALNIKNIILEIDFFCLGNELEPLNIQVYPNLTNSFVRYKYQTPEIGQYKIQIFNMLGQLMYSKNTESNNQVVQNGSIDVSSLKEGIYILSIHQGSQRAIQRFVVY